MATESSAVDTPTLPSPGSGARAALPPPASFPLASDPGAALPAPALSERFLDSVPTLPTAPARPSAAPAAVPLDAIGSSVASPDETAVPTPPPTPPPTPTPPRRKAHGLPVGPIVAVFAAAVVGIAGFMVLTGDDSTSESPAPSGGASPLDAGTGGEAENADTAGSGNVVLETLDETRDVVDQINENAGEAELLDELGLDAEGNPVAAVSPTPAGYRFTWSDPSGQDLDVTVDAATDAYSVVATDGISFRYVGGSFFGTDGTADWYELAADPFGDIPVVGLGGIPTADTVLPAAAEPFVVADTNVDGRRVVVVDDRAFAAADPTARNVWLRPWGLLDDTPASASTVTVRISTDPGTGVVTGAQVETPALGGTATFAVTETYEVAPTIENPLTASS